MGCMNSDRASPGNQGNARQISGAVRCGNWAGRGAGWARRWAQGSSAVKLGQLTCKRPDLEETGL